MKYNLLRILVFLIAAVFVTAVLHSCKKVDIVRIAAVKTGPVGTVYTDGAVANAEIIDLGENEGVEDHGFCWSNVDETPSIDDLHYSLGSMELPGYYTASILGLTPNTGYYFRSFISESDGIRYGNTEHFTTSSSGGTGFWLSYNDGYNYDGVGLNDGSNYDVAIRFPAQALAQCNGFRISKFRFFATAEAQIYVEVYDGTNPDLAYYEYVSAPAINGWTEYSPTYTYFIDSDIEVWAGLWITNYVVGTYPAGVDDGPAIVGGGDMISSDNGATWESLYHINNNYNYNWNLEVYVTNQKGEEFLLTHDFDIKPKEKPVSVVNNPGVEPVAGNMNLNK